MTWNEAAHKHIAKVVADNPTVTDEKELRKLIRDSYPWGERTNYPYKAWCKAVREFFKLHPNTYQAYAAKCKPSDYDNTPLFCS